jgi:hypothetical protein
MLSVVHALNKPDKKYPSISRSICPPRAQVAPGVRIHLAPPSSLRYSAFFRETHEIPACAALRALLKVTGESTIGAFFGRLDEFLSARDDTVSFADEGTREFTSTAFHVSC